MTICHCLMARRELQALASHVALAQLASLQQALLQTLSERGWHVADLGHTMCLTFSAKPPVTSSRQSGSTVSAQQPSGVTTAQQMQQAAAALAAEERAAKVPLLTLRVPTGAAVVAGVDMASGKFQLQAGPGVDAELMQVRPS